MSDEVDKLTADGVDEESATRRTVEAAERAFDDLAPKLAGRLVREAPTGTRRLRQQHNAFKRRLRIYWGPSLDLMWSIIDHHENLGAEFSKNNEQPEPHPRPVVKDALSSLHARACRTAFEVHHLVAAGLGTGALARCRTLHEIAVTANVLNDYSRKPEHADLAERFLLHVDAVRWSEAKTHNDHAEALGFDPLNQETIKAALTARDELRERFGPDFDTPNGWAIGLNSKTGKNGKPARVGFVDLEELSGIAHLRPFYRYSSHQVHSDSHGTASTTVSQGGRQVRLSGYSNGDVFDPVQLALIALHQVTTAIVLSGDRHHPADLLMLRALSIMLEDTLAELGRAQKKLDDAEDHVLAGLNSPTRLDRARDALLTGRARLASRGRS